jgi:serine phosphatase RsbU (regulator of sigma subunit)
VNRFFLVGSDRDSSLRFPLREGIQTIGRASDCDIALVSASVSKRHAQIELSGTQIHVRDLGSKNGTFVNKNPAKTDTPIRHGDTLSLGSLHMEIVDTEETSYARLAPEGVVRTPYSTSFIEAWSSMEQRQPKKALEAVHEAGQTLAQTLTIDALYQQMLKLLTRHFTADRILIFETGSDAKDFRVVASTVQGASADAPLHLSRTLLDEVLVNGRSLLTDDAASDDRFAGHQSIILSGIHSAMAAPLLDKGTILGMIYVDSLRRAIVYSADELRLLTLLANMTAVKAQTCRLEETERERQRLLRELELAARIQRKLVPHEVPEIPGYSLFMHMTPCNEIGGDLFDIRPRADGRVWLAVGDVTGKGIGAALLMSNVMAALRFLEDDGAEPLALVDRLQARLLQHVDVGQFVTLFSALLDPETGRVLYVNAGHAPPIHIAGGSWRELDSTAPPVALVPSIAPQAAETTLGPGETLLIFSDGLSETAGADDHQYDEEQLGRFLDQNGRLSADEMGRRLLADVDAFRVAASAADDLTLLIVQRL